MIENHGDLRNQSQICIVFDSLLMKGFKLLIRPNQIIIIIFNRQLPKINGLKLTVLFFSFIVFYNFTNSAT